MRKQPVSAISSLILAVFLLFTTSFGFVRVAHAQEGTGTSPNGEWTAQRHGQTVVFGKNIYSVGQDDAQRVLILFDEPPFYAEQDDRFSQSFQFAAEFHQNEVLSRAGTTDDSLTIEERFTGLINAVAATASVEAIEALRSTPGVRAVVPERKLKVTLDFTTTVTGAHEVWKLGVDGSGIKVAILDTGIDYTHPALGGCFGPSCKVIGGWDFVNNDGDPMDDDGHGTHVAGIVASSDKTYRGVAQGAKLLAYKVCNDKGECYDRDIIAALERAVADGADVINLSLSGLPMVNDPLAEAVNRVVDKGVIVVAAAGNEGNYKDGTIGSPGIAEKAITVGASDDTRSYVSFSSVGPVDGYRVKPDLTAPGVLVTSTYPNASSFVEMGGTSMASPHVAGAVALLKQLHPTWSVDEIKASLMNTTYIPDMEDMTPYNVYYEGAGAMQVDRAAKASILTIPASFGFQVSDHNGAVQEISEKLTVKNVSSTAQTYSISSVTPSGISVEATPNVITLNPGKSTTVNLKITVIRSSMPDQTTMSGYILLTNQANGQESYRVALGFSRFVTLTVTLDEPTPFYFAVHNREKNTYADSNFFFINSQTKLTIPPEPHDIMVVFQDRKHIVVREGFNPLDAAELYISKAEAKNKIRFRYRLNDKVYALSQASNPVIFTQNNFRYLKNDWATMSTYYLTGISEYYFSDIHSPDYLYDVMAIVKLGSKSEYFDFNYHLRGPITTSRDIVLDTSTFKTLEFVFAPLGDGRPTYLSYSAQYIGYFEFPVWKVLEKVPPYGRIKLHLQPMNYDDSYTFPVRQVEVCTTYTCGDEYGYTTQVYETPFLKASNSGVGAYIRRFDETWMLHPPFHQLYEIDTELYPLNFQHAVWNGRFQNTYDHVSIDYNNYSGHHFLGPFLLDTDGNVVNSTVSYKLARDGRTIREGNFWDEALLTTIGWHGWELDTPVTGNVIMEMTYNDFANGGNFPARVVAEFNTTRSDPNPPFIETFQPCDETCKRGGATKSLYLKVGDESEIQSVLFYADGMDGRGWQPLIVTPLGGGAYRVDFTPYSASEEPVPVRFMVTDTAGNSLTQVTLVATKLVVPSPPPYSGYTIFLPLLRR